jgi:predicted membrane channel-forming protein YqfA (hemolysin III family)
LRVYNRLVIYLAIAAGLVNTLLALWGQKDLGVYFAINVIAYLVIILLYTYLNPRARRALDTAGYLLLGGFLAVAVMKVVEILSGR